MFILMQCFYVMTKFEFYFFSNNENMFLLLQSLVWLIFVSSDLHNHVMSYTVSHIHADNVVKLYGVHVAVLGKCIQRFLVCLFFF